MNFSFLPTRIKKQLETIAVGKTPLALARSNNSIGGEPGESYVVAYKETLFFFFRKLGDHDYSVISGDFGKNISNVYVRKDGINILLDVTVGGENYSLKFSSFEEENLMPIMKNFAVASLATSPPKDVDNKLPSFMTGMAAALMFVSTADDEIATEEDRYIVTVCNNNKTLMQAALQYYKKHSFDELLIAMSGMNREQKLCCLANMMEIAMCDGVLHRSEIKIIKQFCNYMELSDDEYDTVKQVLMIKNKLSVMDLE